MLLVYRKSMSSISSSPVHFESTECVVLLHQRYLTSNNKDHEQLFDLVEKMLDYDPAKRLTLDRCLQHPFFSCYHQNGTNNTEDRTVKP